jgi:beta-phosphoglucomutase-like phosphatase (HAD superfamily)
MPEMWPSAVTMQRDGCGFVGWVPSVWSGTTKKPSPLLCSRRLPARLSRCSVSETTVRARLDAILFDCDGVLAETERDAHRVAFNLAFEEKGLDTRWGEELYGELLEVGGGKERMTAYWNDVGWPPGYQGFDVQTALVKELHAIKTKLFMELVQRGEVPLRVGVKRLVEEALAANVTIAVCSTSNERAVAEIVAQLGPEASNLIQIFAGDVVERKKPRYVFFSSFLFPPRQYILEQEVQQVDRVWKFC